MKPEENQFLSNKELAGAYNLHPKTLRRQLSKLKGLTISPYQRSYAPSQLQIIYRHFGNPFLE